MPVADPERRAPTVDPPLSAPVPAVARDGSRLLFGLVGALVVVLALSYLALPLMGTDLSAAEAHRDFARDHPLTPIDLRWYGGVDQFGYSLLSQHITALLGTR